MDGERASDPTNADSSESRIVRKDLTVLRLLTSILASGLSNVMVWRFGKYASHSQVVPESASTHKWVRRDRSQAVLNSSGVIVPVIRMRERPPNRRSACSSCALETQK